MFRTRSYTPETAEEVCRKLVSTPFHDEWGKVIGTVSKAWVDNGVVIVDIEFDQPPEPIIVHATG